MCNFGNFKFLSLLGVGVMACGAIAVGASTGQLFLTADGEGHVTPCATCPMHQGMGGLDRRATALAKARADGTPTLLFDAGNWLVGADSVATHGRVIVAAYDALKYDVANLSTKDFYWGKADTTALLKDAHFDIVSANLLDDADGKPLAAPFVVKSVGGEKVAVLGLCEPPPGLALLPSLQNQLAGIRIRPTLEALDEWLPKARSQADGIVVLYYGNGSGLRKLRAKLADSRSLILVGGIPIDAMPTEGTPPAFTAEQHGKSLAQISLLDNKATQLMITPDLPADPQIQDLIATYAQAPTSVQAATSVGKAQPAVEPPPQEQKPPSNPFMGLGGFSGRRPATQPATDNPSNTTSTNTTTATTAPSTATTAPTVVTTTAPAVATTAPSTATTAPLASTSSTRPAIASPRVTITQPRTPQGLASVGLTAEQVNGAIDRGRDFLWNHMKTKVIALAPLGRAPEDILACYALVHAGAPKKYPEFDEALRGYLSHVDPTSFDLNTYQQGLLCMLIESYGDPTFYPKLRLAARRLVEEQGPLGTWDYGWEVPATAFEPPGSSPLVALGGVPLDGTRSQATAWARSIPWAKGKDGDNSTSQFALLGLASSSRMQVDLPPEMFARALATQLHRQCTDGGWGYADAFGGYGSMTCAGVCSIAICRHALQSTDDQSLAALEHGLGWLDTHFSVTNNPESGAYHYYYLYSLERLGRMLETEFIGSHEWYPLGARYLIDAQKPNGRWIESQENEDPIQAVSFALLFLTRATPKLDLVLEHGGDGTLKTAAAIPTRKLYVILDASGSMIDTMDGKLKFDVARDAVANVVMAMPEGSEMGLRVYGHRKRALDQGADDDTELLIPMGKLDKQLFLKKLSALRARGKTPLAKSLIEAKNDLSSAISSSDNSPVAVLLLTDGGEDTMPRKDPVKAARDLGNLKNIRFHILGFDINQQDWSVQLHQMVEAAHGTYWGAQRTNDVLREIRAAALGLPENFFVFDANGRQVEQGTFGDSKKLHEGKYIVKTTFAGREMETPMWVNTNQTTALIFDAAKLGALPPTGSQSSVSSSTSQPSIVERPNAAPKFCTHCGAPLPAGAKFCPKCGTKVGG